MRRRAVSTPGQVDLSWLYWPPPHRCNLMMRRGASTPDFCDGYTAANMMNLLIDDNLMLVTCWIDDNCSLTMSSLYCCWYWWLKWYFQGEMVMLMMIVIMLIMIFLWWRFWRWFRFRFKTGATESENWTGEASWIIAMSWSWVIMMMIMMKFSDVSSGVRTWNLGNRLNIPTYSYFRLSAIWLTMGDNLLYFLMLFYNVL